MKLRLKNFKTRAVHLQRATFIALTNPTAKNVNAALAFGGMALLSLMHTNASAVSVNVDVGGGIANDTRLAEGVGKILQLLEGSFGALIMTAAGIGSVIGAAFGAYRTAIGLLVVGLGAFTMRSFVNMWFRGPGGGGPPPG